jgi:hypothetical protein
LILLKLGHNAQHLADGCSGRIVIIRKVFRGINREDLNAKGFQMQVPQLLDSGIPSETMGGFNEDGGYVLLSAEIDEGGKTVTVSDGVCARDRLIVSTLHQLEAMLLSIASDCSKLSSLRIPVQISGGTSPQVISNRCHGSMSEVDGQTDVQSLQQPK